MSIKLKELPKMLNCPSPIVAIGVAEVISEALGYRIDNNMKAQHMQSHSDICLLIEAEHKNVARWSSRAQSSEPTVESLSDFLDKYEEKPLKVGDYEVKTRPNGVQIGCTFVSWETVRKVAALEPKVESVVTTPMSERKYRFLNDDERGEAAAKFPSLEEIEFERSSNVWSPYYKGDIVDARYRTKLTRAELRAKRGLPPEVPVRPKHNPAGLTDAQVGVSEGWRLLDKDEVPDLFKMGATQYWGSDRGWHGEDQINSAYNYESGTLRTKLSREELATQRL